MGKFNLSEYETVKERKKRFRKDYPDGRIVVLLANDDIEERALVYASVYKDLNEQLRGAPIATGYAHELRDKELSVSSNGREYESVNYTSHVENAEESAIGRALDNAGYAGNDKCSRDEIEKAQRTGEIRKRAAASEAKAPKAKADKELW